MSTEIITERAKTHLESAELIGCKVYGISAWGVRLDRAEQSYQDPQSRSCSASVWELLTIIRHILAGGRRSKNARRSNWTGDRQSDRFPGVRCSGTQSGSFVSI